jgi:hypothetical protein
MPERRAIPTEYRGVKYRSRLEARWAAIEGTLGVNQDALPGEGRL